MLCKHCGAELPDGTEKCQFCGTVLSGENAEQGTKNNNAGTTSGDNMDETKKIDLNNSFFEDKPVEISEEEAKAVYDENEKKRQTQINKMLHEKERQLSEIQKRREEKRAKQKKTKILLISLISVLVLGAIGGGAYYVKKGLSEKELQAVETPQPTVTVAALGGTETAPPDVDMGSPDPSASPLASPAATGAPTQSASSAGTGAAGGSSASGGSSGASAGGSSSAGSGSTASGHSWNSTGNTGSGSSPSGSSSGGRSSSASGSSASSGSSSGGSSSGGSSTGGSSSSGQTSSAPSYSGISTANISSRLAKGGEVVTNSATGKLLMTFTTGNTIYYANVAPGSTTDQIKNKDYTITAVPTGDVYNGNTIYEITSITSYSASDYVLPYSGTRLLTNDDIKSLTKSQLAYARNEIYARHGRAFQMKEFSDYFAKKSWYHIDPNYRYEDEDANLNEIEQQNVKFLLDAENSR